MSVTNENISPSKTGIKGNGLAFDIILDNPKSKTPAKLTPCNTPSKTLTNEDIKNKLTKAEERRQSFEIAKLSNITEKAQKLEEAAKIREELNLQFVKQTEQKLIQKMESNKENRAAQLTNLLEKLRKTDNKIAQIKDMTSKETQLLEEKIKNKLIAAEENRLEKLNSITERLKEHESHVEEVRKATTNTKEELEEKNNSKIAKRIEL